MHCLTELHVEKRKFFPSQFLPPFSGLGRVQVREETTKPVLPLARLPESEYRQGEAHGVSDQELHPPCCGCLDSLSVVFLVQVPCLHQDPPPHSVPSSAGWEVQV